MNFRSQKLLAATLLVGAIVPWSAAAGPVAQALERLKEITLEAAKDRNGLFRDVSLRSETNSSKVEYWLCGNVIANDQSPRQFIADLKSEQVYLYPSPEVTERLSESVYDQCLSGFEKYSRGDDIDREKLQKLCSRNKILAHARAEQAQFNLRFLHDCRLRGTEHPFANFDQ